MNEQPQQQMTDEHLPPARELAVWLRAVRSYFNHANQPLADSERANISARNFKSEARVVRDALMRCLHLLGAVERGEVSTEAAGAGDADGPAPASGRASVPGLAGAGDSLG
ncbi:MAG TPA: hypothetical protein VE713_04520, partial [Pyrinomonadaceae bacterium]|nr:hypothetical protein [Pyrinomonadaceae bacterium]